MPNFTVRVMKCITFLYTFRARFTFLCLFLHGYAETIIPFISAEVPPRRHGSPLRFPRLSD